MGLDINTWLDNIINTVRRFEYLVSTAQSMQPTGDRMELVNKSLLYLGMIRSVVDDFTAWLTNRIVLSLMPEDLLAELTSQLRELAIQSLQVDIDHTTKYAQRLRATGTNPLAELLARIAVEQGQIQVTQPPQQQGTPMFM